MTNLTIYHRKIWKPETQLPLDPSFTTHNYALSMICRQSSRWWHLQLQLIQLTFLRLIKESWRCDESLLFLHKQFTMIFTTHLMLDQRRNFRRAPVLWGEIRTYKKLAFTTSLLSFWVCFEMRRSIIVSNFFTRMWFTNQLCILAV